MTPGPGYAAGWFRRTLLGDQWRDVWTTPIEVRILDLQSFDGGLRPSRRGGGLQTKNLHLDSGNGRTWVFRSVDKDASGLLDPDTKASIFGDILQDLTSTIHPGAALVVAPLLSAAGILHAAPQLAVMPDDAALREFRRTFAGMLGLLEDRSDEGGPEADKVVTTVDLFFRLETRTNEEVDAAEYLRARLLDVLVGDWDRHLDQWRWARIDGEGKRVYRPIPRDRDQAFSKFGGIVPSVAEYYTKQLASFGESYPPIDKLTFSGRFTDRRFLVWLDRAAWQTETAALTAHLTDAVIDAAVRNLPPQMYAQGGEELSRALRVRRDHLATASRDYYELLANQVDLHAAEGETIEVRRQPDGVVEVRTPRFRRLFFPQETSELRVYTPRGGRVVTDGAGSDIEVRVVPADGREAAPIRSRYEPVRDWGRDLLFYPELSYDSTRGIFPGARAELTTYGFERAPYASRMDFSAAYATAVNRPRLRYDADFRTPSPLGALVTLSYSGVEVLSFYGFGNQTRRTDALASSGFYNVREEQLLAFPAIAASLSAPLRAYAGIPLRRVFATQAGSAADGLYGSAGMTLVGGEAGVFLDTHTGALTGRRGFRVHVAARTTPALLDASESFSKIYGTASASFGGRVLTDVFLDLQASGEKNWGKYPFFEAAFLGGTAVASPLSLTSSFTGIPLRGYDFNRFAGDSAVAGNADLRIGLGRFLALLPFRYGLAAVGDIGRVFLAGESSSRWHHGIGGGVWLAIFAAGPGLQLASSFNALVVRSDEKTAFYFSTGFGF